MRHINQLATQNFQTQSEYGQRSSSAGQSEQQQAFCPDNIEAIEELWASLSGWFSYFAKNWGDEPHPDWIAALSNVSPELIAQGAQKTLFAGEQSAPSLPKFLSYCKPERSEPMHRDFQLPAPCNIDRAEGKKRSEALMAMMRGTA